MIRPDHPTLSIVRQCRLASISRSTFYHVPRGESGRNLALMGMIDRQFLETPFYGARQMTWHLRAARHRVNIKRVRRPMRLMGLMPIYRQPRTTRAGDRATQPGLVRRHHIHFAGAGLSESGGDHGLVEPQGPGLAFVEHHGRAVLRRFS